MPPRSLASLIAASISFAPAMALAAPPEGDRPPVQRPATSAGSSASPSNEPAPVEAPASDPEPVPPVQPEAGQPDPSTAAPAIEPEPTPEPTPEPVSEPALPTLLESDEPETPRTRVASSSDDREQVDHRERLRGYYANIYRPKHNPTRLWFAARGAYSLTGGNQSSGGGRMGFGSVEVGQTWNFIGYGIGATVMGGGLTFGDNGIEYASTVLAGGGPSVGLGRLALLGRGYVDLRVGYNFFYAPVIPNQAGLADPADAAPHGPKVQLDLGLLLHDSESRRFRHGLGATIGWQMLVHTFTGEYPRLNSFNVGLSYFFG